jgi:PKHD-type hydroxylase
MFLIIEDLLPLATVARFRAELEAARWIDGRATAGYQSGLAKHNLQLAAGDALAQRLGGEIVAVLGHNLLFQSAALPADIFPPLFNRYESGHEFDTHVDSAIRPNPRTGRGMRTDLSATLFLSDPTQYDGGELIIDETSGERAIRLPAGHMALYPATTLHRVAPVRRGVRLAAFFWVQSLVADAGRRSILFDIDLSIQNLRRELDELHPALVTLTGAYHNLVRQWASA